MYCHDKNAAGKQTIEWIDYGMSIFTAQLLRSWLENDPFDLETLTNDLARRDPVSRYKNASMKSASQVATPRQKRS